MTSDALPAGADPHRLLADARQFAHRVRLTQRVTWLPLLVLGLVIFGAIPAYRFGHTTVTNCQPLVDGGQNCDVWQPAAEFYWLGAVILAYVVIAAGYLRVARARGVDPRVLPYVLTGIGLAVVMFAAVAGHTGSWFLADPPAVPDPSAVVEVLFRLLTPIGGIGLALLVLAWLERNVALLLFALGYLAVVLIPIDFGWEAANQVQFVPMLVISGTVLLLGSAGFALAQRVRQPR